MFYSLALSCVALFLSSCSDNASVMIQKHNLKDENIYCLKLLVSPENEQLQKYFESSYSFDATCPYLLTVSTKSEIVCNSEFNYQAKTSTNFPSSYLKMQVNKEEKLLYDYYKDIKKSVTKADVKKALSRLEEDLSL